MSVLAAVGGALGAGQLTGNHPGYILTFHTVAADGTLADRPGEILHSDAFEAEIRLPLAGDLRGGEATLVVVGLTDDHHGALAARGPDGAFTLAAVRVHLFWRDTNTTVGGYLANLVGIGSLVGALGGLGAAGGDTLAAVRVAELAVTGVARRRGSRRYETVVTAVDRVARAAATRLREPLAATGFDAAATRLAHAARVALITHPVTATDPAVDPAQVPFTAARGERVTEALGRLARLEELAAGRYGRGMLLVRDGTLHTGPRPIPLEGTDVGLDYPGGLLSVEALAPLVADTEAGPDAGPGDPGAGDPAGAPQPPRRDQWRLLLRGRPDIRPGDVVAFEAPAGEGSTQPSLAAAVLGAFAAPLTGLLGGSGATTRGYVTGVTHTVTRAQGFLSDVSVVGLAGGDDGWDRRPAPTSAAGARGATEAATDHPDAGVALRNELEHTIARRLAETEVAEVGEVRAVRAAAEGRTAAQRTTLWQGTTPAASAAGGGSVGLPIDRATPLEKVEVPYATPFAWGRCGLVLPRYPGTRVVSVHRHGLAEEPVDVGAVWPDGEGPDAQAGDWWLSLPVGVPADQRVSLAADAVPTPPTDTVTNDLTDADGHRVIEVGDLRVRVGPDSLGQAGTRPTPAADDIVLSIEHADGTTLLQFSSSGDITIVAKGKLTLSGAGVSIDAGDSDIELKATNVKVSVDNQMSVE